MQQTLTGWLRNTAGTPLYAVLANTNGAEGIKAYYREDGSRTPFGLYANTQYANWFEVMPVLVALDDGSPFLRWVAETPLRNWGWLARSPLPQSTISDHLRGLTQVSLPSGKEVFFRYWDGRFLLTYFDYYGDHWGEILPVFSAYWVNGRAFTCPVIPDAPLQAFPWWRVPQGVVDAQLDKDVLPLVLNICQILRRDYADMVARWPGAILEKKIRRLLTPQRRHDPQILAEILRTLAHA
ncbi:Uncharacterised protein [Serratia fonticola]|uniref:DUF4123 domain-containing protein n=1 Tax=Serratia fonticola TaxID=47917 RepID=A0A4U9W8W7_SERFO|nr:DUF4123 domain-containing protein [Serratia fonticola]CAI1552916.1 Uncharacterised protein [Serratia fonticola]CAI1738440.1 Uncharacterised protein [Serratia fonticola]CAI2447881.1 Uncharacterised protein [Serratia fonticola]VTR55344.1 Uncharacterised protein [Serratia fonticola]